MHKNVFQIAAATAASIVVSLIFVLVFSLIMQLFQLPATAVKPVNQVFKIVSIAAGGLIFIRGGKGLIKGLIYGLFAVVLTCLLYGAISHSLSFSWLFAAEVLLGTVAGGISGIIAVNIKKSA